MHPVAAQSISALQAILQVRAIPPHTTLYRKVYKRDMECHLISVRDLVILRTEILRDS